MDGIKAVKLDEYDGIYVFSLFMLSIGLSTVLAVPIVGIWYAMTKSKRLLYTSERIPALEKEIEQLVLNAQKLKM